MDASRRRIMADLLAGQPSMPAQDKGAFIDALAQALQHTVSLPQRALGAAGDLQRTGQYDPEPVVETAMHMVGAPGVPRGALGSSVGPLFHGSPTKGLTELAPSTRGPLGPGVYTSPLPGVAGRYGDATYELPARDVFRGHGHRADNDWHGFKNDQQRLIAAAEPDKQAEVARIVNKAWSGDGYPMFWDLSRLYGGQEQAHELFKRAGFQGLSGQVDGPEVLLFGPQALGR